MQRSPTLIVSIEPSAQLVYAPYNEGTLDDNDLIATSMPLALARKSHVHADRAIEETRPGIARRPAAHRLQARLWRRRHRLAVQISHPRRRLLFQRRLLRPDRSPARSGCAQFSDIEGFVARRRADERRRDHCRRPDRAGDRLQARRKNWCANCSATKSPSASARSGALATTRNCATCSRAPRSPASGSSPAASRNAGSTRNIWRCRSRRSRKGCCRGCGHASYPVSVMRASASNQTSFRGDPNLDPEFDSGSGPSDHPGMTGTNGRNTHADHSGLGRASLPRGGELGEAARRLEPHRRRLGRGRQQGPHLRLQSRRPSDGGARSRRQFHHELGRRPVQPRARAAHRRRRQSLLHRRRRPYRAQMLDRRQGAADHRHPATSRRRS